MIVVLVALVITTTAVTVAVRARIAWGLSASHDQRSRVAADLLDASRSPIEHWLAHDSARLVLPPDMDNPHSPVLHDRWKAGPNICELRITAWDQCGMIPLSALSRGHGLGRAVPAHALKAVRDLPHSWTEQPGLDQLQSDRVSVFPAPRATTPDLFGTADPAVRSFAYERGDDRALGAFLATHNPPTQVRHRRGPPPVWLNVNSAPASLLEEALRLSGIGGLDAVLAARADGVGAALNALVSIGEPADSAPIRFVASSPSWAFRIDIRVGTLRRSWWEVWTSTSSHWEAVQRLAITE